jgi:hypothetical protein
MAGRQDKAGGKRHPIDKALLTVKTDEVVLGRLDREGHRVYDSGDLQDIQILADKANEAKMVMEANSQVMTSLRDYYKDLAHSTDLALTIACKGEMTSFLTKLGHMIADFKMHTSRAELMIRITGDRKDLVRCLLTLYHLVDL